MLDGVTQLGKIFRQSTVNKGMVVMKIWVSAFSISKSFYKFIHPFLPGLERETTLQIEIPLINPNISYRRLTSQFSELLLSLLFLKITSPPKLEVYFGVVYFVPFQEALCDLSSPWASVVNCVYLQTLNHIFIYKILMEISILLTFYYTTRRIKIKLYTVT